MSLPLSRFTVLDLTSFLSGPTCVRQLGDWGANVIKIDAVDSKGGAGIDHSPTMQNLHRNKRSMTLNLKSLRGREILFELAAKADVIVENYRPNVKHKLGIDYEPIAAINPRIVYGSISGFGQDGPYSERPCVDQIAQGMGGLMSITGPPDHGPLRVGIPITDLTSGLLLAQAILMALLDREVTGAGQWVSTSLLEAQIFMLDYQAARWLIAGEIPGQTGNAHPTSAASGAYPTMDGYINIAPPSEKIWAKLCEALNDPGLIDDPDYATPEARLENRSALGARIGAITSGATSSHWDEHLNKAGVPCGPIYSVPQTFNDPQVRHLGITVPVEHPVLGRLEVIGQPIRLSRAGRGHEVSPAPEPCQHTAQILTELGYPSETIEELAAEGIVGLASESVLASGRSPGGD